MTTLITLKQIKDAASRTSMYILFLGGLLVLTLGLGLKASQWILTKLVTPEALAVYKNVYTLTTQTYGKYYAEFPFLVEKEPSDTNPTSSGADEPSATTTVAVSDGIVDTTIDYLPGIPIVSIALIKLNIRELKKVASALKLRGYSNMTVAELTINIYDYMHNHLDTNQCLKLIEEATRETAQQSKEVEPTVEELSPEYLKHKMDKLVESNTLV